MDISDHQLSSHGLPLLKLPNQFPSYPYPGMPLDYVNNLHHLDYPNINHATQLPSIPFTADSSAPSSLIHYASQPYLMFPSMNMSSISQLDLSRSCTTTFDYPFNQIYHDSLPSSIFNYGVDHQQALPTCEANYDKGLTYPSNHEELADPFLTKTAKQYTFSRQDQDASRVNMEVKSEIIMPNYGPSSLISDVSIPLAPTFLHNLVDMESHHAKEDAYDSTASFNDLAASTSADCFDFPLPSFNSARENLISQSKRPLHAKESINSSNTEAPCSHAGSTATACKTQAPKKRKSQQQKRVVCVRATGGLDKPTGECLPSDSWAWRKYGQKAIKGSPYPRSYYRCSSLKGCTARKQVERNPSDPLMIILTYTSDHSHPPSAAGRQATKTDDDKGANATGKDITSMISGDLNDQISEESCEPNSSEDNNTNNNGNNMSDTNMINTAYHHLHVESDDQEQGVSSTTVEESLAFNNNQGLLLSSNGNMATSERKLEEDFFAQLDELPDWSGGNPLDARLDHITDQEGINHGTNSMDPFDLFDWS